MMLPDAIDKYTSREWILSIGDGQGKFEPAAAFFENTVFAAGKNLNELSWRWFAQIVWVSAEKHAWLVRRAGILKHIGARRRAGG